MCLNSVHCYGKGPPEMYQLYAVLVHAGSSCNSGHYYCYVRSPGGHWYCMNDAQVGNLLFCVVYCYIFTFCCFRFTMSIFLQC